MVSKVEEICDGICALSLLEAADVVKCLEGRLGCSASAPQMSVASAGPAASAAADESSQAEPEFKLKILGLSDASKKIAAIKFIRVLKPNFSLKEAKDYVENPPSYYEDGAVFSKSESEDLKKKFVEAGFDVQLEAAD